MEVHLRRLINVIMTMGLTLILVVGVIPVASFAAGAGEIDAAIAGAGSQIVASGDRAGWSYQCEWSVMSLARNGKLADSKAQKYCAQIASKVRKNKSAQFSATTSSDNSRVILALTAAGYDVRDFAGYNLLKPLTDMRFVTKQGLNGPVWALIAFDSHNYEIPAAGTGAIQTTREVLIREILSRQDGNRGWSITGKGSDVDMTCMVIYALAPYYKQDEEPEDSSVNAKSDPLSDAVKTAVDNAVAWLSSAQNSDGSFTSSGAVNSESISQVIVALASIGIDPNTDTRFVKGGRSAVDALLTFRTSDGGFKHLRTGGASNGMATVEGYYALCAYKRMLSGENPLFDMNDTELRKYDAGPDSGDSGKKDKGKKDKDDDTEKVAGKPTGKTKSLGYLALEPGSEEEKEKAKELITETAEDEDDEAGAADGTGDAAAAVGTGGSGNDGTAGTNGLTTSENSQNIRRAMPWIYMAIAAAAAIALIIVIRKREDIE